ncbi:Ctr copper transporter family-domain-containing protein [Sporodiniella umbellata]|nr:Ctr copper transporter family-domain-containing protein [Sporodiniella umbellata]
MSSMPTGSGEGHSMSHMMMGAMGTFHWGTSGDGLWIDTWVPQSKGAYAGALIGILIMSALSRGIPVLEVYLLSKGKLQAGKPYSDYINESVPPAKSDIETTSKFTPLRLPMVPAFSWKSGIVRSTLSAFSTFISYLLMMAVMTGNGGYFFILVAGVFVGEMVFGRYKQIQGVYDGHEH